MKYHTVKLTGGPAGHNCRLELDGVEIQASAVEIKAGVDRAVNVVVTIPAANVEMLVRAKVTLRKKA